MSEQEMIQGCINRESKAETYLFKKYFHKVLYVCKKYSKNFADAEDCLQETFMKIYRYLPDYKGSGSFEGWVKTIAKNTVLKKYTTVRYQKEITVEDLSHFYKGFDVPKAFENLRNKEVNSIIKKLPEGYKTVFNLNKEGFSHEEISKILKIQPGTSRSQLAKARKILQQTIKLD